MSKQNKRYTQKEYLERINQYPLQVLPIEEYIDSKTKILHKCVKCSNEIAIRPNAVLSALKNNRVLCQKCGGNRFCVGKNDLWTTHPQIAKC